MQEFSDKDYVELYIMTKANSEAHGSIKEIIRKHAEQHLGINLD